MKFNSEKISNETYNRLGYKELDKLISKRRNNLYLKFFRNFLSKEDKTLDLACGYGRLTIPLAKEGYNIEGIDLSENFIKEADSR